MLVTGHRLKKLSDSALPGLVAVAQSDHSSVLSLWVNRRFPPHFSAQSRDLPGRSASLKSSAAGLRMRVLAPIPSRDLPAARSLRVGIFDGNRNRSSSRTRRAATAPQPPAAQRASPVATSLAVAADAAGRRVGRSGRFGLWAEGIVSGRSGRCPQRADAQSGPRQPVGHDHRLGQRRKLEEHRRQVRGGRRQHDPLAGPRRHSGQRGRRAGAARFLVCSRSRSASRRSPTKRPRP